MLYMAGSSGTSSAPSSSTMKSLSSFSPESSSSRLSSSSSTVWDRRAPVKNSDSAGRPAVDDSELSVSSSPLSEMGACPRLRPVVD